MKKISMLVVVLLTMTVAAFAQQTKAPTKADKQEALRLLHTKSTESGEAAKPDPNPMLLSDAEKKELDEAISFIGQAKKQYDTALSDTLTTPLERMNALEVVGRLQKSFTVLQSAHQHLIDLRDKHKVTRPDCKECEYAPDMRSLVRPNSK